ncbi:MAG: molecular chaperone DnaJ [Firmicutes bacterium]|nr:molecular chaperone DnaJ [Bacillota bacterium]
MENYYKILGVSEKASEDEIKNAYRSLAKKYHPDLNKDNKQHAEKKFKEVSAAYDTLSNKDKRAAYDFQLKNPGFSGMGGRGGSGAGARGGQGFGGGGFGGFQGFGFSDSIFEDIFSTFGFSTGGGGTRKAVGADLNFNLTITFEEAAFGAVKEVQIKKQTLCGTCKGTGAKGGTSFNSCASCGGKGKRQATQQTPFGTFSSVVDCPPCKGTGKIIKESCTACKGKGKDKKAHILKVTIPAGVDHGQVLTLRGEGDQETGGPGNVNIVLSVAPHPTFKRKGADLHLDMPVTFIQAALGDKLKVDNIDGTALTLDIKEGTQPGTEYRFKGKGIKHLRNDNKGDVYITISVDIPTNLTAEQKEILQNLQSKIEPSQYKKQKGFFEKIKDAFKKK